MGMGLSICCSALTPLCNKVEDRLGGQEATGWGGEGEAGRATMKGTIQVTSSKLHYLKLSCCTSNLTASTFEYISCMWSMR